MERLQSCPKLEIIKVIGAGAFGTLSISTIGYVFEAYDQQRQQKVALKRMQKVGKLQSRECEILSLLKGCDYAIQMLDVFYSRTDDNKLVQNIVLEFMDQNLENILNEYRKRKMRIQTQKLKSLIYQMFKGLESIHKKSIAHRDLKPENILLKDNKLKFCDFGSAKIMISNKCNTPYIVSRYYRAPELILGIEKYTVSIDIWSIGCIMGELALLEPIFQGASEGDQLFAIFKVLGSLNSRERKYYDKLTKFKNELFDEFPKHNQEDLKKKFNFLEDKENFIDLFLKLMKYIPEERLTASEALQHPYFKDLVILESKLQII